jgi:hypothetical protein
LAPVISGGQGDIVVVGGSQAYLGARGVVRTVQTNTTYSHTFVLNLDNNI